MILYDAVAPRREYPALWTFAAIVGGSLLMTLSAKVQVPFYPVPLSMQTFVAIGLGLALGPMRGAAAVLLYLAEGASGLPVFAGTPQQGIGVAYMAGPTGGYLVGFVAQALLAGFLAKRGWDRRPATTLLAALLAGASVYLPGLLWLGVAIGFDKPLLKLGLYPFMFGDVVKAVLAALVFPMAWKALRQKSEP
jgi:biotin transport system substrate-specific component